MTSDIDALYADVILNNKRPRPSGPRDRPQGRQGQPLCGDRLTVYTPRGGRRHPQATFQGFGCAIARRRPLMTEGVTEGPSPADALLGASADSHGARQRRLTISALSGAGRHSPVPRASSAPLPWQTLRAAVTARAGRCRPSNRSVGPPVRGERMDRRERTAR
jgi:nitrogen fixation NifU-like protein